jgi:glycosyltransferase involved in cell wall biosynthesis
VETHPLRKLRWLYNYLQVLDRETALQRRIHAAICVTEPDRKELLRFCADVPVHVINTGVDLDYFYPQARPERANRLIFVGAFQHEPNVDAMIHFCAKVLPRVRAVFDNVQLSIVGSNPPPQIVDLAHIPGVRVTGFVPDIRPAMMEASVYVVPLRLGVGIRGKVLEAWGMALPVVATSTAASGLRFQHDENLLLADTDEDFAASVIRLLQNAPERERIGGAGRNTAEQFYGWDSIASQLDGVYRIYLGRATASNGSSRN